jgi:hypothetical protein
MWATCNRCNETAPKIVKKYRVVLLCQFSRPVSHAADPHVVKHLCIPCLSQGLNRMAMPSRERFR